MDKVKVFKDIANEISALYAKKNEAYGDSFGQTYEKLGIISAVTRISDKYNRLCSLATNKDIDDLGESIEDTLIDLAAYSIMTLVERRRTAKVKTEAREDVKVESYPQTLLCTQEMKNDQGMFLFVKGKEYERKSLNVVVNELDCDMKFAEEELAFYFSQNFQ